MPAGRRGPPGGKSTAAWAAISLLVLLALWFEPIVTPRLDFIIQDALSLHKAAALNDSDGAPGERGLPPIAIIVISEQSMRSVGRWPWPRQRHAELLRALSQARLVAFDIVMPETSDPEGDHAFAEAAREHGSVFMGFYATQDSRPDDSGPTPVYPYPELFEALAGIGMVNAGPDVDGIVRRSQIFWQAAGLNLPSLPLAAAQKLSSAIPGFYRESGGWVLRWENTGKDGAPLLFPAIHLDGDASARFLPLSPGSIAVYEYSDVVSGIAAPELFAGSVVLVGVSGAGAADLHRAAGGKFMPGVWFIAQSLNGLMTGRAIMPVPQHISFIAGLLLCFGCAAAGLRCSFGRGAAMAGGVLAACTAGWGAIFWSALRLAPLAAPVCAGLIVFVASIGWRMIRLEREMDIRALPLDEILLLPQSVSEEKSFSDHLRDVWPKIHALCPFELLEARAGLDSEEANACLAEIRARGMSAANGNVWAAPDMQALLYIPHYSKKSPFHRMLIPLHFDGEDAYAIIGWDSKGNVATFKSIAALIISIAAHYKSLEEQGRRQRMFLSAIQAMSGAIDAKDPVTSGHSERVAELGKQIAKWLGWPPAAIEEIYFAGILHDVGKIGVPDNVLNKPGKLEDNEFIIMQSHPAKGAEIMRPVEIPEVVLRGIAEHHERLDGKGYPHGLPAEEISQAARILKIADVYDALVSKRQYKEPWPAAKACDLIYSQRGTEFDSHIAEVFLQHMAPSDWTPPEA